MVNIEQRNGFGTRLKSLFNGRSTIARQSLPSSIVSPKSPAPRLGVSILASPRIDLPGLPSHLSPFPRSPTSTHLDHGGCSPPPATIAAPASALSRQDASPAFPLSPHLHCTTRSSPPSTWQWEHVRDSSGNTRRRRRRLREAVRPRGAKKSLLREKTGRLKLVRCLGLGLLLAVGLSVCEYYETRAKIYLLIPAARSGLGIIRRRSGSPSTHFDDRYWPSSRHGIRTRHGSPRHVYPTASPIPA